MILPDEYIKLYSNSSQATQISYILKKYTNSDDVILDANAGIGGNSFYFVNFINLYIVWIFQIIQYIF